MGAVTVRRYATEAQPPRRNTVTVTVTNPIPNANAIVNAIPNAIVNAIPIPNTIVHAIAGGPGVLTSTKEDGAGWAAQRTGRRLVVGGLEPLGATGRPSASTPVATRPPGIAVRGSGFEVVSCFSEPVSCP